VGRAPVVRVQKPRVSLPALSCSQAGRQRARHLTILRAAALAALFGGPVAHAQAPPPPGPSVPVQGGGPPPAMKALGGDRYQIGGVLVDKRARQLTVRGRVAHLGEAPLEYLAVTTKGFKAYETLLEVDASGSEFNLGLILLGFDAELSTRPDMQFDRRFPGGQVAVVEVRWTVNGRTQTVSADEALLDPRQRQQMAAAPWIYTGSFTLRNQNGRFAADAAGTLVGFVHDPSDIIERREGLGIGQYGSIRGNTAVMPPLGTPVELIVTATNDRVAPGPARTAPAH
jgi:hypothetical protein